MVRYHWHVGELVTLGDLKVGGTNTPSHWHLAKVGLLALWATIGFDLFLHAGVLATLYQAPSPFLLSPEESFRRIPLGYVSFAIMIALLAVLVRRLGFLGWKRGMSFGLSFGAFVWGSLALGLYSISTASPGLLLGWFLGQTVELGIAGLVVGVGLQHGRLRSLLLKVAVFFVVLVALAVVLQNVNAIG
ncbi:MAG: hypothetical protein A2147_05310 [Chloroflexi bacterium RBG_16_57_8]|nr:MAG: hypothetical protein A2147_05310 [Chloroflexi bacterium RBG_16_57_8]